MNLKRLLGTLMFLSVAAVGMIAQQPLGGAWHPDYVKDWSPENDPDAKFNRSTIALQPRIDANDIKANEYQYPDGKIAACLTMNPMCSMTPSQGADNFIGYNPTYWQYMDMIVWWGGSSGEGIIIPPSAPVTDICHMNGVKVLGNVFFPPTAYGGKPEWVTQMLTKEGDKYPYAEKMYEIAKYYGFDGWFLNEETYASSPSDWVGWIEYFYKCAEADGNYDMEIQWYDANLYISGIMNLMNVNKNVSYFANYGSAGNIDRNVSALESAGYSKAEIFSKLYTGIEKAQGGLNGNAQEFQLCFPTTGHASSMQIFNPEEHIWKQVVSDILDTENNCGSTAYERMKTVFSNESRVWTNTQGDPSNVQDRNNSYTWPGLANGILERSVIQYKPFVTAFSAGLGKHRFVNGEKRGTHDWYHRGMQSILPTWRWWVETSSSDKLSFEYNWDDAYNFGTSVVVSGNMTANADHLTRLYKTSIKIDSGDKFQLVYKTATAGSIELKLGVKENSNNFTTFPISEKTSNNGWSVAEVDLSSLAGKTVSIIALNFKTSSAVSNYKVTLGQLGIIPSSYSASAQVSNLAVQKELQEEISDLRVVWDAPQSDDVDHYDVYLTRGGNRTLVGQTRDEGFYISKFTREDGEQSLDVDVVVVTKDMKEGQPVKITLNYPAMSAPEVSISASPTLVRTGERVTLTATANRKPEKYEWVLPEGVNIVSQEGNQAVVTFANEALYSITVKVTNQAGTTTETLRDLVEVDNSKSITNVALGKVIHSVSGNMNNEGPEHLIDGVTNQGGHEKWCTGGSKEHWVIIDLKQPYQLYEFRIFDANLNEGGMPNLNSYKVLLSNDLENWEEVLNTTGRKSEDIHTDWIKPTPGRYIKFVPYDEEAPITIRIWEFEAYGAESSLTLSSIDDQAMDVSSELDVTGYYSLGGAAREDNFAVTVTPEDESLLTVSDINVNETEESFSFKLHSTSVAANTNVTVTVTNGDYAKTISFLVRISDSSMTNLILNKVATVEEGSYPATDPGVVENLTDGNYESVFKPKSYDQENAEARFVFDLGGEKEVSRFQAYFKDEAGSYEFALPTKVKFEVSENGTDFTVVNVADPGVDVSYSLPEPVKAKAVAFRVGLQYFMSTIISELEVYGKDSDNAVDKLTYDAVSVAPNPVTRGEDIMLTAEGAQTVEIVSLQGVVVKHVNLSSPVNAISTSDLTAGTYLMVIKGADFNKTVKVVVR